MEFLILKIETPSCALVLGKKKKKKELKESKNLLYHFAGLCLVGYHYHHRYYNCVLGSLKGSTHH